MTTHVDLKTCSSTVQVISKYTQVWLMEFYHIAINFVKMSYAISAGLYFYSDLMSQTCIQW